MRRNTFAGVKTGETSDDVDKAPLAVFDIVLAEEEEGACCAVTRPPKKDDEDVAGVEALVWADPTLLKPLNAASPPPPPPPVATSSETPPPKTPSKLLSSTKGIW